MDRRGFLGGALKTILGTAVIGKAFDERFKVCELNIPDSPPVIALPNRQVVVPNACYLKTHEPMHLIVEDHKGEIIEIKNAWLSSLEATFVPQYIDVSHIGELKSEPIQLSCEHRLTCTFLAQPNTSRFDTAR